MHGRVTAVNGMFVPSSNELGAFKSVLTEKYMEPVIATVVGGCATLLIVALSWSKPKTYLA